MGIRPSVSCLLPQPFICVDASFSARFFPHEVADLSIVLGYISRTEILWKDQYYWALRYALLLWLSLICMLPFDLSQFDDEGQEGQTAGRIQDIGRSNLSRAGVERDAAAILLARSYTRCVRVTRSKSLANWNRKDMIPKFPAFLEWCLSIIQNPGGPFTVSVFYSL